MNTPEKVHKFWAIVVAVVITTIALAGFSTIVLVVMSGDHAIEARYHACRTIPDPKLRRDCISGPAWNSTIGYAP